MPIKQGNIHLIKVLLDESRGHLSDNLEID